MLLYAVVVVVSCLIPGYLLKNYKAFNNGISEDLFNRGLCLPSGSNLSNNDLKRIVNIIKSLYEK